MKLYEIYFLISIIGAGISAILIAYTIYTMYRVKKAIKTITKDVSNVIKTIDNTIKESPLLSNILQLDNQNISPDDNKKLEEENTKEIL